MPKFPETVLLCSSHGVRSVHSQRYTGLNDMIQITALHDFIRLGLWGDVAKAS